MTGQRLGRSERLRTRPEYERVYDHGARIPGRFMTLFVLANGREGGRCGIAATRKLGSAVIRNRAKRLAREIFRRRKIAPGYDVVIVPRREMLDAPFTSLEADYERALERRGTVRPGRSSRPRRDARARPAPRV